MTSNTLFNLRKVETTGLESWWDSRFLRHVFSAAKQQAQRCRQTLSFDSCASQGFQAGILLSHPMGHQQGKAWHPGSLLAPLFCKQTSCVSSTPPGKVQRKFQLSAYPGSLGRVCAWQEPTKWPIPTPSTQLGVGQGGSGGGGWIKTPGLHLARTTFWPSCRENAEIGCWWSHLIISCSPSPVQCLHGGVLLGEFPTIGRTVLLIGDSRFGEF